LNTQPPLISIIIPTYNRKEKLTKLIQSTQKSTYKNLEIIVVDDASIDNTYENIKKLFPDIKIVRNEKEKFSGETRSIGSKYATGDYIFFLDDDNIIDKYTIENIINVMQYDKSIGIGGPLMFYYNNPKLIWCAGGKLNRFLRPVHLYSNKNVEGLCLEPILNDIDYFPNAYIVRKELISKVLRDYKNFSHNWEEQDFCLRIKNLGYRIVTVTSSKIWHDTNVSKLTKLGKFKTRDQARSRIIFLKKFGNMQSKLFFWLIFFPVSTIYYLFIILFFYKKKCMLINSYIEGTIEGIKSKVTKL
jgi:GT2 family glycosyltransferase